GGRAEAVDVGAAVGRRQSGLGDGVVRFVVPAVTPNSMSAAAVMGERSRTSSNTRRPSVIGVSTDVRTAAVHSTARSRGRGAVSAQATEKPGKSRTQKGSH